MRRSAFVAAAYALTLLPSVAGAQAPIPAPAAGAPMDRASFPYQRRIHGGPAGVAWLQLDLAALSHSTLSDVRLVTDDGFQVPYLVENDPVPLRVTLPPLKAVDDPDLAARLSQLRGRHGTVYILELPLAMMPPCQLVLDTPARVFERGITLLSKNQDPRSREQGRWETRAWETWRHSNPDEPAAPLVLHLPSLDSRDARVVVDEGDNPPLPLGKPVLEVRTWRLRFVREAGHDLWLVYGRRDLEAPRYDLALVGPSVQEAAASEAAAEPEKATGPGDEGRHASPLFWTVLLAAMVALLALVARLLRN